MTKCQEELFFTSLQYITPQQVSSVLSKANTWGQQAITAAGNARLRLDVQKSTNTNLSSIESERLRRKHGCGSVVVVASWRCIRSDGRRELLAGNLACWGCRLDLLCRARSSIRRQQGAGLFSLPRPGQHHLLLPRARIRWDFGPG